MILDEAIALNHNGHDIGQILIGEVYTDVAEDNGQRLVVLNNSSEDALVWGDNELLTQMVANLIENAITHCPAGTEIALSLEHEHGRVLIAVLDDGPGIPAAEREKVFQRLYRLDKSRTTPGSGLGLSLVKAIADLHSATIVIGDNEPGLAIRVSIPSQTADAIS